MPSHQHHHDHTHSHSLGEQNRHHFDQVASTIFQEEWVVILCEQVTRNLRAQFSWMGVRNNSNEPLTMLDYACGNGVVSRAMAKHIPIIRGMDISSGMVEQYNDQAAKAGHAPSAMHAVQGDIVESAATTSTPQPTYDLIIMSLALHHVQDPNGLIAKLAQQLKPRTGVLVILDWIHPEESGRGDWMKTVEASDNPARHTVTRPGFKEDDLKGVFAQAGLEGWKWERFDEESVIPNVPNQRGFLARGIRKA
ncbi:hypothetical protein K4F52_002321 [Lecanicillium sp. MT-2017a]|nr:hypothetical protein K4F52_002321 [Lecanicillium sp. MT-2017a]